MKLSGPRILLLFCFVFKDHFNHLVSEQFSDFLFLHDSFL